MKKYIVFIALCFSVIAFSHPSLGASSSSQLPDAKEISPALSALSIPFIENRGQIDSDVAYYAKTFGATLFVTRAGEMVYGFPGYTLVERIPGLTPNPKGLTPAKTNVSSFIGNDLSKWQKTLPTYTAVSLGEVTRGMTLTLKAYGGRVEKIITVSPHTDPSLAITVDGAFSLGLSDAGELLIHTDKGELTFSKPFAYQEINGTKIPVAVAYMLAPADFPLGHPLSASSVQLAYSFSLGPYDPSYSLTIDPILQSTYLGGGGDDYAYALAIGTDGVYVAGSTRSSDFPGTEGGAQPAIEGGYYGYDAFVALLSPDLTSIIQSTYLGGSSDGYTYDLGGGGDDYAYALAIGTDGVYVAGSTRSSDFPATEGGAQPTQPTIGVSDFNAFVALLSPDLTSIIQSTYLGGNGIPGWGIGSDEAYALAIGTDGLYVAGYTSSTDFPGTEGGAQPNNKFYADAFVSLLSFNLTSIIQSTYLGGSGEEFAYDLAIGTDGVYVAGYVMSNDFPGTEGGAQPTRSPNSEDAFVALLSPDLTSIIQSTYLGGGSIDYARAIAIGAEGIYVAGFTWSSDFPGTAGGAQETSFGGFVSLLSFNLTSIIQSTYLGGSYALAIGTDGVYVAGYTASTDFPGTEEGAQPTFGGGADGFVSLLSFNLTSITRSTYLGGGSVNPGLPGGGDEVYALAIGTDGVYVAGSTGSTNFPRTEGGAQPTPSMPSDAFVSLLTSDLKGTKTLTVIDDGQGTGTVTSDPAGISCGTDCSEPYLYGTVVTLSAKANAGSTFAGWYGGGCSGTGTCVVTMNADSMVPALFLPAASSTTEGTIGTKLNLTGTSFGTKKGKVLIGGVATKIATDGWKPNSINCTITKLPSAGIPHDIIIMIQPYKTTPPIILSAAFTVKTPQLNPLGANHGTTGSLVTITGNFFGTKKGKVYLENPTTGKKKSCRIKYWYMEPANGESTLTFLVPNLPKNFSYGEPYPLKITNKVGTVQTYFTVYPTSP